MFRKFIFFFGFIATIVTMFSCSSTSTNTSSDTAVISNTAQTTSVVNQDDGIRHADHLYTFVIEYDFGSNTANIVLPDGTTTNSFEVYAEEIFRITEGDTEAVINIIIGDKLSDTINTEIITFYNEQGDGTDGSEPPPWVYQVSSYTLSGGSGLGYVGGCLKRNGSYYAVRLNRGSQQVFDLHFVGYTSGGSVCVGFYESVRGWCWTDCTPTYTDVVGAIVTVCVGVGLSYATAYVIANIAAPLVVAALAI